MSPTTLAAALLAGLLLPLGACVPQSSNPLACKDDGSCAHQEERTFCDIDGVYSGTIAPNECVTPPSDDACNRIETCSDPAKPNCTDDSMGVCVECTENAHCSVDGESCNTNTGECGDFTPCTPGEAGDAECAANADGNDYCSDGGVCAACIVDDHCSAAGLDICDETSFECRACEVGGDDCASGLCGTRDEGECVPEGDVIHVAMGGTDEDGCGDMGDECATIAFALTQVDNEEGSTKNIIAVGTGTYEERLSITEGEVTILGAGATPGDVLIKPSASGGNVEVIHVEGSTSSVTLSAVTIDNSEGSNGTNAVSCEDSATVQLVGSAIQNSENLGLIANNCDLTITGSTISGNQGGGIDVDGGTYSITNNFVVENGDGGATGSAQGGVLLSTVVAGTFSFNTLSDNNIRTNAISGSSLTCSRPEVLASSNIVVGGAGGAGLIAGNCTLDHSLTDLPASGTNITGDPLFENPALVDYHLKTGSPCINEGDPAATLATDIDGEERPQGGRHDIGADEAE